MDFRSQINRIKEKLDLAKKADPDYLVFGASSHKYEVYDTVDNDEIDDFEKTFNVALPPSYRAFLTEIGNGGPSYFGSAAGPYYGIFPFKAQINFLVNPARDYLSQPVTIFPNMTTGFWDEHTRRLFYEDGISDEAYHEEMCRVYGGLLPVGSQGCSFIHVLVLNGDHRGKVVNLDASGQLPQFTYDSNFLDWYERWLDEILSGKLVTTQVTWFGYSEWRSGR